MPKAKATRKKTKPKKATAPRRKTPRKTPQPSQKKASKSKPKTRKTVRKPVRKQKRILPTSQKLFVTSIEKGKCLEEYRDHENKDYKANKELGKGRFNTVYALCGDQGKCPYVLRVDEVMPYSEFPRVEREIKITQIASDHGIAPKLHKTWYCEPVKGGVTGKIFMVSDRMDGSLEELEKLDIRALSQTTRDQIATDVEKLVKKLHDRKIWHLDLHEGNVLFNRRDNGTYEIKLTDFGQSQFMSEPLPDSIRLGIVPNEEEVLVGLLHRIRHGMAWQLPVQVKVQKQGKRKVVFVT